MKWTYCLRRKEPTGLPVAPRIGDEVPDEDLNLYFRIIETLTGLDRPMAERIMQSGRKIEHPTYEFYARVAK